LYLNDVPQPGTPCIAIDAAKNRKIVCDLFISELSHSGAEAWEDLKAGVDLAWEAMNEAIKSATSRLR
jgi:hypothetical protein